MRYIALLRGVNVGGHIVRMERLRAVFSELGFTNVQSYIQSGNVFFDDSSASRAELIAKIEARLAAEFGFAIPACLRTVAEFEAILESDPFRGIELTADRRFCIYFTTQTIPTVALPKVSPKGDLTIVGTTPHEAFVVWKIVNGRPPASDSFLAETLGCPATARFFHTSQKILAAAKRT
ncbi:MAG TPA: DUF1697 domain-containing protein [Candidatus Saccharimonadales bacterium]